MPDGAGDGESEFVQSRDGWEKLLYAVESCSKIQSKKDS